MDFATLIGLVIGTAIIVLAVMSGSEFELFINIPGLMIVLGGSFAATLIKFPIVASFHAFKFSLKAVFWDEPEKPAELVQTAKELARIVRKQNTLALENAEIKDEFLRKGIQLCVDGRKPEFVRKVLTEEKNNTIARHEMGEHIFRGIGESAPAFGMIGTLVGLVQMLSNLSDASAIGPAMAIALLTTLYGALIANLVAIPIADKLNIRLQQERVNMSIILESVLGIQRGENPMILDEILQTYIPTNQRGLNSPADRRKSPVPAQQGAAVNSEVADSEKQ